MSGGKKVFVGNLAYETTEEELKKAFEKAGNVVDSKIVRRGNRSKGFGFVEFSTEDEAQKAVELLDKKNLNDRPINVQVSTSTGTKVGNTDRSENRGGYYRDNYRDNYRENYNYRENNYRENRGPGRRMVGGRRNFNNNGGGGQRKVYYLKDNNRYNYDDNNYNRRNNNRGPRRFNNRGPRNNNNRNQSNVEKVESQTTIFVANLPFDVDDEQLITLFEKCGAIKTAHVVKNRGKSKGYGFVEFEDNDGQKKALTEMDNFQIIYKNGEERNLSVKVAMSTGDNEDEDDDNEDGDNENENNNENED